MWCSNTQKLNRTNIKLKQIKFLFNKKYIYNAKNNLQMHMLTSILIKKIYIVRPKQFLESQTPNTKTLTQESLLPNNTKSEQKTKIIIELLKRFKGLSDGTIGMRNTPPLGLELNYYTKSLCYNLMQYQKYTNEYLIWNYNAQSYQEILNIQSIPNGKHFFSTKEDESDIISE